MSQDTLTKVLSQCPDALGLIYVAALVGATAVAFAWLVVELKRRRKR